MADMPARNSRGLAAGTGSLILTLGGLAAAFGVASCCGLPLLLAAAGLGTTWLKGFAQLAAPHRMILLIVGAACLVSGALLFLRHRPGDGCTRNAFRCRLAIQSLTLAGLSIGAALLYLGYVYA